MTGTVTLGSRVSICGFLSVFETLLWGGWGGLVSLAGGVTGLVAHAVGRNLARHLGDRTLL
jgi:hypothetical protein